MIVGKEVAKLWVMLCIQIKVTRLIRFVKALMPRLHVLGIVCSTPALLEPVIELEGIRAVDEDCCGSWLSIQVKLRIGSRQAIRLLNQKIFEAGRRTNW